MTQFADDHATDMTDPEYRLAYLESTMTQEWRVIGANEHLYATGLTCAQADDHAADLRRTRTESSMHIAPEPISIQYRFVTPWKDSE